MLNPISKYLLHSKKGILRILKHTKKSFISVSRCTKLYVKDGLRKLYIPKFYHNNAKKQAMKVLEWCCGTNFSPILKSYKL